ncbi:hypothetical protein [Streptomyces sp. NRRL B-1381]|uniref:hypothetical protein n=1 Tax=Streptomyces sp. NRRL B-1381 TaxID=1463829 RepID=UPI00067B1A97|nr:hypothetical protein [Streptomyces sp. NRRL B-1381]
MPRTKPSPAHEALVRAIKEEGDRATTTQVERWQQQGWLPRASAWFEPDSPTVRPLILHRALWLASTARPGRSIGWVGWFFWAVDGTPDNTRRLRRALVATLKRPLTQAGIEKIPTGDSDRAFQARQDAARKMLPNRRVPRRDLEATLRAHAAEAGFELPHPPATALANISHWALQEAGARLLLGGAADLGIEGLLEALEQAMPDHTGALEHLREVHRRAELTGTDLLAQSPWAQGILGMVRTIETADDHDLCHAAHICTRASGVLEVAMRCTPGKPEIYAYLTADEMWRRWALVGGILPEEGAPSLAAVALNTYQYLADPEWAAELDRYLSFMYSLLVAFGYTGSPGDGTQC